MSSNPKVSVGLAVYNGENYLEQAIDSLLGQTFEDFEVILSDNASTDRTEQICRTYAARDGRIRYQRNAKNIGGANNENQTVRMACGEYFRWAAHDDVCGPQLLEKLVEALDRNPDAVLSYCQIIEIDEEGNQIRKLDRIKADALKPYERFHDLIGLDHDCEETYGLMRRDAMLKTGLQHNYTDSDRTFLAHMSLYGRFVQVPEVHFYRRIHPKMSTKVFWDWRERMAWFGSNASEKITLPHWMQFFHYLDLITHTPLSIGDRMRCYLSMIGWIFRDKRWRWMGKDVLLAGYKLMRSFFSQSTRQQQISN